MEAERFVGDIGFANSLAEQPMAAVLGKEAPYSLKNVPTNMTCTLLLISFTFFLTGVVRTGKIEIGKWELQ